MRYRFGLSFRVMVLSAVMLTALGGAMLVIALRQQQNLIQDYTLKEIRSKLDPVEKKTEAIRYTVAQLMELDRVRSYYREWQDQQKQNRDYSSSIDPSDYFTEEKYDRMLNRLRVYIESRSGKKVTDSELQRMMRYASILRKAYDRKIETTRGEKQVRQHLVRVRSTGRALDAMLREQFGYMGSLRTAFQGLDQHTARIQTVSLFFAAHFDTSLLEPARELDFEIKRLQEELGRLDIEEHPDRRSVLYDTLQSMKRKRYKLSRLADRKINTLPVGSEKKIRETLDPVRFAYYRKTPAIQPHLEEYENEDGQYMISVETLFMKPSISERAKRIRRSLSTNNRALWMSFLEIDRNHTEKLKQIIASLRELKKERTKESPLVESSGRSVAQLRRDLYKKYEEIRESRINGLDSVVAVVEASDRRRLQGMIEEHVRTESAIELLLEEERNRLLTLERRLESLEESIKEFFPRSARYRDAYEHLRDSMLMDYAFFHANYEPSDYMAYTGSSRNRSNQQKKWDGLREWVKRGCSQTTGCRGLSISYIGSGGELLRPQRLIEQRMWELDSTPLEELANEALFSTTAAFTRIFYDRSQLEQGLESERDRLLDTALSVGIRMLFIAILVSLFFVRTIKEIIMGAERIGKGNLDVSFRYNGKDELGSLVDSLNRMTEGLKHREQMIEELSAAEQIQKQLLPETMPPSLVERLDFGNMYRASSGVGGDYYDYMEVAPGQMAFCIADVTGHGPGPAMVMAMVRSHLRGLIQEGYRSPADILGKLNDRVVVETPDSLFITMFLGFYDAGTGVITYCSSGHNKPLVYRYHQEKVEEYPAGGLPLGLEEGEDYFALLETRTIQLEKGDLFFQYTDGLSEAMNEKREQFGTARIKTHLSLLGKKKGTKLVERFTALVQDFTGTRVMTSGPTDLDDDIAIIAFRKMD